MLGEVEETIYTIEDDDDGEETVKVSASEKGFISVTKMVLMNVQTTKKQSEMLFVRGMLPDTVG